MTKISWKHSKLLTCKWDENVNLNFEQVIRLVIQWQRRKGKKRKEDGENFSLREWFQQQLAVIWQIGWWSQVLEMWESESGSTWSIGMILRCNQQLVTRKGEENWREKIEARERERKEGNHMEQVCDTGKSGLNQELRRKAWQKKLDPFQTGLNWLQLENLFLFEDCGYIGKRGPSFFLFHSLSSSLEVPLPQKLTHFLYTLSPKSHVKVLVTFLFTYQWPLSCIYSYLFLSSIYVYAFLP